MTENIQSESAVEAAAETVEASQSTTDTTDIKPSKRL